MTQQTTRAPKKSVTAKARRKRPREADSEFGVVRAHLLQMDAADGARGSLSIEDIAATLVADSGNSVAPAAGEKSMLSVRIDKALHKRLHVFCVLRETSEQVVVCELIAQLLDATSKPVEKRVDPQGE